MKINQLFGAVTLASLTLASGFAHAEFTDVGTDFSITNGNPNGAWTYGYRNSLSDVFNPFTNTATGNGVEIWFTPGLSGDSTPSAFKNTNGFSVNGVPGGSFGLHSGPNGQFGVAQYKVQDGGDMRVAGMWGAGDAGIVDLYIQLNGTTIWSRTGVGGDEAFDLTFSTSSNDQIQFVLGFAGAYQFDSTPLTATIESVPEPATMSLVGIGLGIAALRRKRKSA